MGLMILTEALAGDTVSHTSADMQVLAERSGFGVSCTFNDILIYTWPGCAPTYAASIYQSGLDYEQRVKEQKALERKGVWGALRGHSGTRQHYWRLVSGQYSSCHRNMPRKELVFMKQRNPYPKCQWCLRIEAADE